jgi:hypothetical protein
LLVLAACLGVGCDDDNTGPEDNPPPAGEHLWSQRFGGGSYDEAYAVAVDAAGNVIVAGELLGTVDFGGGALTSVGGTDIVIAKFGEPPAFGPVGQWVDSVL